MSMYGYNVCTLDIITFNNLSYSENPASVKRFVSLFTQTSFILCTIHVFDINLQKNLNNNFWKLEK